MATDDDSMYLLSALCVLPGEMRYVKRAVDTVKEAYNAARPSLANADAVISIRNVIGTALLRRQSSAKRGAIDDDAVVNDMLYEACRDGFVEALVLHLGPGRVSGGDRVRITQLIDEIRVGVLFDSIRQEQTDTLLSFEEYHSRITAGIVDRVRPLHDIIRPNPDSVDFTDAAYALAALNTVALMPFTMASYFSQMSQVSDLTYMVQMYMRVVHRHLIANLILKFRVNRAIFPQNQQVKVVSPSSADSAQDASLMFVALTALEEAIRATAVHQLTPEQLKAQMGIVMNTSRAAKSKNAEVSDASSRLSEKVGRVRDYSERYRVGEDEVVRAKRVFWAWVVALVAFSVCSSALVVMEQYRPFLMLVAAIAAAVALSYIPAIVARLTR
ncbi:hypothetical protein FOA52_001579 [Chlamydomonas sp. UWO 241]|nr:hypothetical protein FOA52_001579 [Chlamydomonas sp. UWO 241]